MIVGIVGGGVVGQATARVWLEHCREVRVYDTMLERRTHALEQVLDSNLVFVCLPTPALSNGLCDTEALDRFFHGDTPKDRNYAIRSTIPVGYTRKMHDRGFTNVVHYPEFLTARCAHTDAQIPARNIVGIPTAGQDCPLYNALSRRFPGTPLYLASSDTSELCKLAQNSFFATKVAFFNELYSYAEAKGIDYAQLRELLISDGRVGPSHTLVPGPDGKRGFGGTCLPKDLASYVSHLHEANLPAWVAQGTLHRNQEDRPDGTA